ncbi:MAG: hypothetical protein ACOCSD_04515 [Halolamina sp.]
MDTVGELLGRERRSDRPALVIGDRERSYHELITNAYRAGNVLRYHGVGEGRTVAVAPVPDLPPVLTFLGAAMLGAATRFAPVAGIDAGDRLVLVQAAEQAEYDPAPGTKLAVFDGVDGRRPSADRTQSDDGDENRRFSSANQTQSDDDADAAETIDWAESVWSENPAFPPTDLDPGTPLLVDDGGVVSHGDALAAATIIADRHGIDGGSRVVLRSSLADPGAVVAGLVAPVLVGGVAVLADPDAGVELQGDIAVTAGDAPEGAVLDPGDVPLSRAN